MAAAHVSPAHPGVPDSVDQRVYDAMCSDDEAFVLSESPRLSRRFPKSTRSAREVLELIAQGRTNSATARELFVTASAVELHIASIFAKLGLPATDDDHRRVLAVLAYLRASGSSPSV
jgi:DNA-binding NarL/FixJ family response regulator